VGVADFASLALIRCAGPGMWQLIIAMGVVQGIGVSRIMRSSVIAIRENMYVEAAAAIGRVNYYR
tara:strand:+ start:421 stop:615 length:195 start_codon:yes stop_codon:yes gene_type:complete